VWEVSPANWVFQVFSESHPLIAGSMKRSWRKYWALRYEYWPNFADGIITDIEGLYSVTPWNAACEIAKQMDQKFSLTSPIIVDACCGVGGNTIAFAKCIPGAQVIGIDTNQTRIHCAASNTQVFGVSKSVQFVHDDAFCFLGNLRNSVRFVFASPPWGGPGYIIHEIEDIPFDCLKLIEKTCDACVDGIGRLGLFLPRKFPPEQAHRLVTGNGAEMSHFNVMSNGRCIGVCFVFNGLRKSRKNVNNF
jgi:trimethylguanosine synthase